MYILEIILHSIKVQEMWILMVANINATFALVVLNKNDAHSLNLVLNETNFKLFDSVLGIDGDSKDNSLEIFKKYSIPCVNRISGGRGGAIKFAIENISEDFVIFLSSDGEENPEDLIKIKALIKLNK